MKSSFVSTTRPALRGWVLVAAASGALLYSVQASAQECSTNTDCEFGFVCNFSEPAGTTGVGGSASGFCGDGICQPVEEDGESCPEDCAEGGSCVPGPCESHDDCAEGYECGPSMAADGTTGSTAVGTTSAGSTIVCGNGVCADAETVDNCPQDCGPDRRCQPANNMCNDDSECARGYYCDTSRGGSAVGAVSSDGGYVYESYDGYCTAESTTGGEGGTGGFGEAGAAGESGDWEDSVTISNTSTNGTSSGGYATGGSGGRAEPKGDGSGAGGDTASANDSGSGTSSGAGGHGNHGDGRDESRGGCAMGPLRGSTPNPLSVTFALASLLGLGRRRRKG